MTVRRIEPSEQLLKGALIFCTGTGKIEVLEEDGKLEQCGYDHFHAGSLALEMKSALDEVGLTVEEVVRTAGHQSTLSTHPVSTPVPDEDPLKELNRKGTTVLYAGDRGSATMPLAVNGPDWSLPRKHVENLVKSIRRQHRESELRVEEAWRRKLGAAYSAMLDLMLGVKVGNEALLEVVLDVDPELGERLRHVLAGGRA